MSYMADRTQRKDEEKLRLDTELVNSQFTGVPGLSQPDEAGKDPIDYYNLMIPKYFWEDLSVATTKYAAEEMQAWKKGSDPTSSSIQGNLVKYKPQPIIGYNPYMGRQITQSWTTTSASQTVQRD